MPDVKQVLQDEIRRLAKKEVKLAIAPMVKTISELKKRIAVLERGAVAKEKKNADLSAVGSVAVAGTKTSGENAAENNDRKEKKPRFYGKRIIRLRKRLHLSQAELAEMVGVNMFSVSHWELGKNIPRQAQQDKLAEIRALPKKELRERLVAVRAILQERKGKA